MNEEAIVDSYNLFVQTGYKKSIEEFKQLISSNPDALKDSYDLFVQTGYRKSLDDYKGLMGLSPLTEKVKKKEDTTELPSEVGSSVSSESADPLRFAELAAKQKSVTGVDRAEDSYIDPVSMLGMYPEKERVEKAKAQSLADERVTYKNLEEQKPFLEEQKRKEETSKEELRKRTEQERQSLLKSPDFEVALSGTDSKAMELEESEAVKYFTNLYGKYGFIFRETGIGDALEVVAPDNTSIGVDLQTFFSNEKEASKLRSFVSSKAIKPLEPINADSQDAIDNATKVRSMRKVGMINPDGTESSLDFETAEINGKHVVFPTLFPKSNTDNYGSNPVWWSKKKGEDAYKEALKRGEVFEFSNKEDAIDFAEGSWQDINTLDAEAKKFYKERGLDYTTYKQKFDRYEEIKDIIEFLETSPFREKDLTQEQRDKFSSYYLNGTRRQDSNSIVEDLSKEADQLREIVNDSDFRNVREDFDLYLDKGFNQKAKEAASLNFVAKEAEDVVQYESLTQFGVRAEDLGKIIPKDSNESKKLDNLITLYKDAQAISQEAANKYEVAKTWLDAKADKEARGQYVENWSAISNAWEKGLSNGNVGNEILKMSLGLVDLDDDASVKDTAIEIIKYLQESETGKTGRTESRFHQAKGFKEIWSVFKDDPIELATNLAAQSISQMLPYGWKLIAGSTSTGIASGAILGSIVPGAGTAAGSILGGSYGLRAGFAATSVALEYTNAVMDAVRNNGYNPMNPEELVTALKDDKVWAEGKEIGLKRGLTIALMDILGQGLAGRVFKTGALAPTVSKIGASLGERVVFDPAVEAAGEFMAQSVAGQDISGKDIFAEALGGFGNNAPAAAVNMYLDARKNNNVRIANDFLDVKFMASDKTSDSRIVSWANNMEKLGQISAEQNQRIQQNVGLRREARDVLNVGTGLSGFGSTKNRALEARLMELFAAREELTSTPNRQSVFSEKISEINKEISEIATNKKLRPVDQQTILAGEGVVGVREQESATDIRGGIKKYSINGKSLTKAEFLSELDKMTPRRLMRSAITVDNDEETSNILKQKFDAIQEQTAGQVPVQPTTTVGQEVEGGTPQAEPQVTTQEGQEEVTPEAGVSPDIALVIAPSAEPTIQTEEVVPEEVVSSKTPSEFALELQNKYGIELDLLGSPESETLSVSRIVVPKEQRGKGVGAKVMEEIIQFADSNNKKLVLTPSKDFGGTSVKRLTDFYKRFGFVENKGKNKDFTIRDTMYRVPEVLVQPEVTPAVSPSVSPAPEAATAVAPEPTTEPITITDIKINFAPENAIEVEKGTREDTTGRKFTYNAAVTSQANDQNGNPIGTMTKRSNEDGVLSFMVKDVNGRNINKGKSYPTERDARMALAEQVNRVRAKAAPAAKPAEKKARAASRSTVSKKDKREEIISRPAFTPITLARQWLLSGGKLRSKQSEEDRRRGVGVGKGVREETGMGGVEMRKLFSVIDNKKGLSIEVAAERIYNNLDPELQESIDVQDIRNAIIEVLLSEDIKTWEDNQDRDTSESQMSELDQFMYNQLSDDERAEFDEYQQTQSYYNYLSENSKQLAKEYDAYVKSKTYQDYIEEIYGRDREGQTNAQNQDDGRGQKQGTDGETDSVQRAEREAEAAEVDEIINEDKGTLESALDFLEGLDKKIDKALKTRANDALLGISLTAFQGMVKGLKVLVQGGMKLRDAIKKIAEENNISQDKLKELLNLMPIQEEFNALLAKADALIARQKSKNIEDKRILSNAETMLRKEPAYINATDAQRKIMERETRARMGVEPRKAASIGRVLGALKDITNVTREEKLKIISRIRELGRDVGKELAKEIRAMKVNGQITTSQATNIISRLTQVNPLNETSVSNFVDYMTEVFAKVQEKNRQSLLKDLVNLVSAKAKTARTESGKRRGKGLDAVGQSFFDAIKPIIKAAANNDVDALEKIKSSIDEDLINDLIIKTLNGEELTTRERVLLDQSLAYDTFADLANMDIDQIQELYNQLKDKRAESIANLKSRRIERAKEIKALHEEAKDEIKAGFNALYNEDGTLKNDNKLREDRKEIWNSFRNLKIWDGVKKWADRYDFNTVTGIFDYFRNNLAHLGTLSNILDKKGKFFTNNVYNALNDMDTAHLEGYYTQSEALDQMANKIDGITKGYSEFKSKMSNEIITLDNITSAENEKVKWQSLMNQDQAMRIYALYKNPVQRAKLIKMGFDEANMKKIEGFIGPDGKQMADMMVDYFSNAYYESVNKVYRQVNDVSLGYVENYFPTKTISSSVKGDLIVNGNFSGVFDAETAPSLKERTDTTSDVLLGDSFTDVVENHIQTMERYKAYAEGVKRLNAIFKSPDVRALLGQNGTDLNNVMKNLVNFAVNPNGGAKTKNTFLEKLMTRFTGFALSFKLVQIPKQATSFITAYEDYNFRGEGKKKIPGLDAIMFMVDTAKVIANLPSEVKKAQNISASFRDRLAKGLDGDVYGLESGSPTFKPLGQQNTFLGRVKRALKKAAGLPTVIGDVLGVMGYMVNYNRNIANGMNKADALRAFNNYNATQQSRRAADKIALQTSQDALKRSFTMFGSTTFLQMNKAAQGTTNIMRSLKAKKMPASKDIRGVVLNVSLANVLFVAASNIAKFIDGDDEDRKMALKQMRDAALGLNLLYQVPLIGGGIELAIKRATGDRGPVSDVVNPYISVFNKLWRGVQEDDISKSVQPVIEIILGTQIDPFIGLFNTLGEGFNAENIYDMVGISRSYRPGYGSKSKSESPERKGMTKTEIKKSMPTLYKEIYGETDEMMKEIRKEQKEILKESGIEYNFEDFDLEN